MENKQHNILVSLEHQTLSMWDKSDIFNKSLEKNTGKKNYIFYDGPPFATGLPHHGHLLASTIKDIIPRYKTMQGYYVPRRFGWDCHGLPIEHEINKSLGMHAHQALEQLGIAGYNKACRDIVMRYREEWATVIRRIGRWVDLKNDYKTMDVEFMESVWWVFSELWKKELIYKGEKVVPYSQSLGTVLSNFEAGSNYQNTQDPSITVKFELDEKIDGYKVYALIWTTTPWTLVSNLALCINGNENYVIAQTEEETNLLIAEKCLENILKNIKHKIIKHLKGIECVNLKYKPLFDLNLNLNKDAYRILADDYVITTNGTGIVHMAPAFGEDDQRVCFNNGITKIIDPLDEKCHFDHRIPMLEKLSLKDANSIIISSLKTRDLLFSQSTIMHSYPFCPRSDTPLIYRAIPSWYVNVTKIKSEMLKINQEIHWVPEHIKNGRFGQWLLQAKDWAISRNRVWGTPLPLWINNTNGKIICMSDREMLKKHTGVYLDDLHREFVDNLSFKIPGEEGVYSRIEEVLDCWFESGSMPWAQQHYPFSQKDMSNCFPADFIAEGLDQTRGWFYTLTVISAALQKRAAFNNVIVNGIVTAEDGKKMSKRLKNYTSPMELMEKYGADALRLYMIHSGLVKGEEQRFSDYGVEQMAKQTLMPWTNAVKFFTTYAEAEKWSIPKKTPKISNILDKWILSKCSSMIKEIDEAMEQYHLYQVVPILINFIEDLTNTYIRMNRARFWGTSNKADQAAFYTLYEVLYKCTLCMAPFTPMIAEAMYQELKKYQSTAEESVHLNKYPKTELKRIKPDYEELISWMQRIITLGRHKRNNSQIPIKTPLKEITIIHQDIKVLSSIKKIKNILLEELNVHKIILSEDEEQYVDLKLKPNSRVLGKRLGSEFKQVFDYLKNLKTKEILVAQKNSYIDINGHKISKDDWDIERINKRDDIITDGIITLQINTNLDNICLLQGKARELLSFIQKYRKHKKFNISDRIQLKIYATEEMCDAAKQHKEYIMQESLCTKLEIYIFDKAPEDATEIANNIYIQHVK